MTLIRQLTPEELIQNGIQNATMYVAERDGKTIGAIVLGMLGNQPYASDLQVDEKHPEVAAMLIQKVRKTCKQRGYPAVTFSIDPNNPSLLPLIQSGKARIDLIWVSMNT